jgi:outer membrane protein
MKSAMQMALVVASAGALSLGTTSTQAAGGDWLLRAGVHQVDPKSNNHPVVGVAADESLTLSLSYFFTDRIAVDVLAAYPFTHAITLNADGSKVGQTSHMPPTVSLQYHFLPDAVFRPYVGAGLNYTVFFDEETQGALAGTRLSLKDSWGLAAEFGVDIALNDNWALNLSIRWFDIDTDATLDGVALGTVEIDPYAYGLMFTRKFRF